MMTYKFKNNFKEILKFLFINLFHNYFPEIFLHVMVSLKNILIIWISFFSDIDILNERNTC